MGRLCTCEEIEYRRLFSKPAEPVSPGGSHLPQPPVGTISKPYFIWGPLSPYLPFNPPTVGKRERRLEGKEDADLFRVSSLGQFQSL